MFGLPVAFLAGVVTIAAPCTLPVLPILFGASMGRATTARPILIALGFVASFGAVALTLGAVAQTLNFDPVVVRNVAAVALAAFGLSMIWPALYERAIALTRTATLSQELAGAALSKRTNLGGFLLGSTLGLVWTPCAGPVLGAILTLIARSENLVSASAQLFAYALGAAVPMLFIAYGGQALTSRMAKFAQYAPRLRQMFGVIIIAIATATYLQYDTDVIVWLTSLYPTEWMLL